MNMKKRWNLRIMKLPKNIVEVDFIVSIEEINDRLFISCVSGSMF